MKTGMLVVSIVGVFCLIVLLLRVWTTCGPRPPEIRSAVVKITFYATPTHTEEFIASELIWFGDNFVHFEDMEGNRIRVCGTHKMEWME